MEVDLIIPTLGAIKKTAHPYTCFERLQFIPWPLHLHLINRGRTWAEAINIGLAQTSGKNDVILMDDDVFINKNTFTGFLDFYDQADIFGFKLMFPTGEIQHAGGYVRDGSIGHIGYGQIDSKEFQKPVYVCHATTSLVYIKRAVIHELKGMAEDIPGIQCEDIDFSFRALKAGFKILYLPGEAVHLESATKRLGPDFKSKIQIAFKEVMDRHLSDADFLKEVESYPKPLNPILSVA